MAKSRKNKASPKVYMDGETIPDDRINQIFRWPPLVPRTLQRSSLIVGSRGVGKTTLFRFLKSNHDGPAIHLALGAEFASFGKDAAMGPLGAGYSKTTEQQIAAKANSLLALSLAERLSGKKIQAEMGLLLACLPKALITHPTRITTAWCRETRELVSNAPLEEFVPRVGRPLVNLVSELGRRTALVRGRIPTIALRPS